MKTAISFMAGVIVCGIVLVGVKTVVPIYATDDLSAQSDNTSQGLLDLLPDIERIYQQSLVMPFQKAAGKIYDEDIAQFYQELLDNSVLYQPGGVSD